MKKNKLWLWCVELFVGCAVLAMNFCAVNANAFVKAENDFSTAKAMCVLEQTSGRVLFEKNKDLHLPMASTTKVFTALTVLENCKNLDEKVSVDDRAVGIEGTSIYLRKGESLTVKELLLGMMLPSGNDAATALAYFVGGDISTFCEMMQKTAQNAGAYNSSFKNPHGLDEEGHYTTAYDLAKVSAKALENETFYEISTTKSAIISGNEEVKSRYLRNKNKLLKSFEGCNGVKTGFTDNAGRCFVASATRNNMTVVCSVLNCGDMFEECSRCMNKAFCDYQLVDLLDDYSIINNINVVGGRGKCVKGFVRFGFSYPLTEKEKLLVSVVEEIKKDIKAPILKEDVLGEIKVYLKNECLFSDKILSREDVKKDNVLSYFGDIAQIWV